MIPSPIRKVLSTLTSHQVRHLLMGGQACVLYGAAEFSRDTDVVLMPDAMNFENLRKALVELQADCIAVPPFDEKYLARGHAVHFRCQHPDAIKLRVDVMTVLRGVAPFEELWQRRTTISLPDGLNVELMNLADLVQAKKTQRDKDWPMIRRLIESHYSQFKHNAQPEQVDFWLREGRTPSMLFLLAHFFGNRAEALAKSRPLLTIAISGNETELEAALKSEEVAERERDRIYWKPLRTELETLRLQRTRESHDHA